MLDRGEDIRAKSRLSRFANIPAKIRPPTLLFQSFTATDKLAPCPLRDIDDATAATLRDRTLKDLALSGESPCSGTKTDTDITE